MNRQFILILVCTLFSSVIFSQERSKPFTWPDGKKVAVSLSFDDARLSQVDAGIPVLDSLGVKATFYLNPAPMRERLEGWKKAVAAGHEIGNHSTTHPCSGNYSWVEKDNELENFTMDKMRKNLLECSKIMKDELGVTTTLFAYPCGQKFVSRGINTKSYVPVIAEMFKTGRGFLEEAANDPAFTDFAQITGIEMDGKDFEQLLPLLIEVRKNGQWIVLAGHEMGKDGVQTTRFSMLRKLIAYAQNPSNKLWIAPVGTIATYIQQHRE